MTPKKQLPVWNRKRRGAWLATVARTGLELTFSLISSMRYVSAMICCLLRWCAGVWHGCVIAISVTASWLRTSPPSIRSDFQLAVELLETRIVPAEIRHSIPQGEQGPSRNASQPIVYDGPDASLAADAVSPLEVVMPSNDSTAVQPDRVLTDVSAQTLAVAQGYASYLSQYGNPFLVRFEDGSRALLFVSRENLTYSQAKQYATENGLKMLALDTVEHLSVATELLRQSGVLDQGVWAPAIRPGIGAPFQWDTVASHGARSALRFYRPDFDAHYNREFNSPLELNCEYRLSNKRAPSLLYANDIRGDEAQRRAIFYVALREPSVEIRAISSSAEGLNLSLAVDAGGLDWAFADVQVADYFSAALLRDGESQLSLTLPMSLAGRQVLGVGVATPAGQALCFVEVDLPPAPVAAPPLAPAKAPAMLPPAAPGGPVLPPPDAGASYAAAVAADSPVSVHEPNEGAVPAAPGDPVLPPRDEGASYAAAVAADSPVIVHEPNEGAVIADTTPTAAPLEVAAGAGAAASVLGASGAARGPEPSASMSPAAASFQATVVIPESSPAATALGISAAAPAPVPVLVASAPPAAGMGEPLETEAAPHVAPINVVPLDDLATPFTAEALPRPAGMSVAAPSESVAWPSIADFADGPLASGPPASENTAPALGQVESFATSTATADMAGRSSSVASSSISATEPASGHSSADVSEVSHPAVGGIDMAHAANIGSSVPAAPTVQADPVAISFRRLDATSPAVAAIEHSLRDNLDVGQAVMFTELDFSRLPLVAVGADGSVRVSSQLGSIQSFLAAPAATTQVGLQRVSLNSTDWREVSYATEHEYNKVKKPSFFTQLAAGFLGAFQSIAHFFVDPIGTVEAAIKSIGQVIRNPTLLIDSVITNPARFLGSFLGGIVVGGVTTLVSSVSTHLGRALQFARDPVGTSVKAIVDPLRRAFVASPRAPRQPASIVAARGGSPPEVETTVARVSPDDVASPEQMFVVEAPGPDGMRLATPLKESLVDGKESLVDVGKSAVDIAIEKLPLNKESLVDVKESLVDVGVSAIDVAIEKLPLNAVVKKAAQEWLDVFEVAGLVKETSEIWSNREYLIPEKAVLTFITWEEAAAIRFLDHVFGPEVGLGWAAAKPLIQKGIEAIPAKIKAIVDDSAREAAMAEWRHTYFEGVTDGTHLPLPGPGVIAIPRDVVSWGNVNDEEH